MKKLQILICIWSVLFSLKGHAKIVYVDRNHTGGSQTGTSWTSAFSAFQNGVNSAHAGDTIWVAAGTYSPPVDSSFTMKEGVKILGGFLNTDISVGQRNPATRLTILRGNNSNVIRNDENGLTNAALIDGFTITNGISANGAGIRNTGASPVISNCRFTKNGGEIGLGIYNYGSPSVYIVNCVFDSSTVGTAVAGGIGVANMHGTNAQIINCTFRGNTALHGYGAGINNLDAQAFIKGCSFFGNNIGDGGAISSMYSACTIDSCFFYNNSAGMYGGAVEIYGTQLSTVRNCVFKNNFSKFGGGLSVLGEQDMVIEDNIFDSNMTVGSGAGAGMGGAIYNQNDSSKIYRCIFVNNRSAQGAAFFNTACVGTTLANCLFEANISDSLGGAAFNSQRGYFLNPVNYSVVNCTFIKNTSPSTNGECLYNDTLTSAFLYNCIIWGNTGGILNHDASCAYTTGYSLIQEEPASTLLHNLDGTADPLLADTVNRDYRPKWNSPCINTGDNGVVSTWMVTDLDERDRISYGTVDMGAYEYKLRLDLNDTIICDEVEMILNAGNPGSSYLWNTGATSQTITVNSTGTYSVTVSNIWGTISHTFTVGFGTMPLVDLGSDVVTGMSVYILDADNPGANYLWNTGANTQTINVNTNGLYHVTVTNASGCSASDSVWVTFALGIESTSSDALKMIVSPNPARDNIEISISDPSALHDRKIFLYNIKGQLLRTFQVQGKKQVCSLEGLAPGMYLLAIKGYKYFKILKQ